MEFFAEFSTLLEETSCDFNHFFYRLGLVPVCTFKSREDYERAAEQILPVETDTSRSSGVEQLAKWLETKYRPRLENEKSTDDQQRRDRMQAVNPKFVLRQWVLEEVIKKTP